MNKKSRQEIRNILIERIKLHEQIIGELYVESTWQVEEDKKASLELCDTYAHTVEELYQIINLVNEHE
jgi:hypothetical protein